MQSHLAQLIAALAPRFPAQLLIRTAIKPRPATSLWRSHPDQLASSDAFSTATLAQRTMRSGATNVIHVNRNAGLSGVGQVRWPPAETISYLRPLNMLSDGMFTLM